MTLCVGTYHFFGRSGFEECIAVRYGALKLHAMHGDAMQWVLGGPVKKMMMYFSTCR